MPSPVEHWPSCVIETGVRKDWGEFAVFCRLFPYLYLSCERRTHDNDVTKSRNRTGHPPGWADALQLQDDLCEPSEQTRSAIGSEYAPAPTAYYQPAPHPYGGWPEDLASDWDTSADSEDEEEENRPRRSTGVAARARLIQCHIAFLLSIRRSSRSHVGLWRKRAVDPAFQLFPSWISRTMMEHFSGMGRVLWKLPTMPIWTPGVCSSRISGKRNAVRSQRCGR